MKLLGNKKFVTALLFRGSEHGRMGKDFHSRCDNKGPTISLYKVKDGDCIGGFTKAQWESPDSRGKFVGDSDSFLFNLSSSRQFTNTGKGVIRCRKDWGPWFGNERGGELCACEPFNGDGNCESYANKPGYKIVIEGGKNMLTNKEDGYFTITELEVWQVTFIVNNYII